MLENIPAPLWRRKDIDHCHLGEKYVKERE
jgi:hypothetical protein